MPGCRTVDTPEPPNPAPATWARLAPDREQAALAAYDARVSRLERFWARVTLVINAADASGERFREQGEGHLQIELPRRFALTLGKVGDPRLYLGSNDTVYWWIDTIDSDRRFGAVGRHDLVTQDKVEALGLTIRPLDVIELLGIRPLADDGSAALPAAQVSERADTPGVLRIVARREADLTVLIEVDAERSEPRSIALVRGGVVVAQGLLSDYQPVVVTDDRTQRPRVATQLEIRAIGLDGAVRLALYDAENRPLRDVAFDVDRLLKAYRVREVLDLDAPVTEGIDADLQSDSPAPPDPVDPAADDAAVLRDGGSGG